MLATLLKKFDKPLDYNGQNLSNKLMNYTIVIGMTIAFLIGYVTYNLKYTLIAAIITSVVSFFCSVPSWPFLRAHPLKFKKEKST
ncbi:signal peptidase complex subunit 1 [Enteropsectra breve]|nr:signal peptidase complex subunit 1 [Enteropsectra breve]KAI5151882.1 signal peptidase complex subunit 1 [Enteropsectra breve]